MNRTSDKKNLFYAIGAESFSSFTLSENDRKVKKLVALPGPGAMLWFSA
jgi:hypothetical protein